MRTINGYTTSVKGFTSEYGKKVRRLRTLWLDESQAEFAKRFGISAGHVCQIELGRVQPSKELREKIDEYMIKFDI